jgi:hypothetical protein
VRDFLIKVEDVFEIKGRDLLLAPSIPVENVLPKSATVLLVRPDESELEVQADFAVPLIHFRNVEDYSKRKPAYEILLKELAKAEVPIGTKIWLK